MLNTLHSDLLGFIDDVNTWMSKDDENIIAVHCKGGKGRTGTCISSWLIESGKFNLSQVSYILSLLIPEKYRQ